MEETESVMKRREGKSCQAISRTRCDFCESSVENASSSPSMLLTPMLDKLMVNIILPSQSEDFKLFIISISKRDGTREREARVKQL